MIMLFMFSGCTKVPSGYVGVKVYLLGTDKGVDVEELGVGRYWIGLNEELHTFPTFTQNYSWTKDTAESSPDDESMNFQTVEGMDVNADIGISYSIRPEKVSLIFQKYRKGVDEITDIYLRNMVRDALVTVASTRPVADIYGKGKADIIKEVQEMVSEQVDELGIDIERIYWIGSPRLPDSVVRSINAKLEATQKAHQRQNEVAEAKAQADKRIEEARGSAESTRLRAIAEAEAIRIKGEALKDNPQLVQLEAVTKWDGKLPQVTGETTPFINLK